MISPTSLALVRHGESTWVADGRFQGQADPPLTDIGRRQARAIGARLAAPGAPPAVPLPDVPPVAIWHSPLRRATETAQAIHEAREADAPLRPLETLLEISQGEWEGLTHDEVSSRYPDHLRGWLSDPLHHHAPGGEPLPEAFDRARRALDTILGGSRGGAGDDAPMGPGRVAAEQPVDLVLGYGAANPSRGRPSWAVVVAHDGILRLLALATLGVSVERFWSFPFALAAISVLDLSGGVARLRAHNLDEHLAAIVGR